MSREGEFQGHFVRDSRRSYRWKSVGTDGRSFEARNASCGATRCRMRACLVRGLLFFQSPIPRGSANPEAPATTLRTLMIAAAESERPAIIAGTLPPISVNDA